MRRHRTLLRSIIVAIGVLFTLTAASAFAANEGLVGAVIKTDQGPPSAPAAVNISSSGKIFPE